MQLLPVIDLLNGQVVRGIAGQRNRYREIQSQLCTAPSPPAIAHAFREQFGLNTLYVADLDGIQQQRPHTDLYRQLVAEGFELFVDAGIRSLRTVETVLGCGVAAVIAGLEMSPDEAVLRALLTAAGRERAIFSVDLQSGQPLGTIGSQPTPTAWEMGVAAWALGFRRLIVLDLAGVGVGRGVETVDLCRRMRAEFPELWLATGGGVRNVDDLCRLEQAGVDAALVASALHDGRLTPAETARFRPGGPEWDDSVPA